MKWQMYSNSNLLQQGMHCKCTHVACGAEGRGKRRARATSAGGGGGGAEPRVEGDDPPTGEGTGNDETSREETGRATADAGREGENRQRPPGPGRRGGRGGGMGRAFLLMAALAALTPEADATVAQSYAGWVVGTGGHPRGEWEHRPTPTRMALGEPTRTKCARPGPLFERYVRETPLQGGHTRRE